MRLEPQGQGSVWYIGRNRTRLARNRVSTDDGHELTDSGVVPSAKQHVRVCMVRLVKTSVTQLALLSSSSFAVARTTT